MKNMTSLFGSSPA